MAKPKMPKTPYVSTKSDGAAMPKGTKPSAPAKINKGVHKGKKGM